ncbi:hypothetical protein P152DRAFT_57788 [Eremomyces bilateralis CBS 781.70]|uniref:Uncharacterized protein n=1 Tax=Eremomyces bilateralis CBS 781.70 TaxID=1392243 RepID=A0A6G1G0N9_9PEZI|nr:uncharacterized protein P152DRAFT_57788 [Eremomyces bilateralis CBS 781.70]KAF1811490.1 hypothetical protein P152DRAFT_57788 [Eremomyces bilateralis CBS 781.70]
MASFSSFVTLDEMNNFWGKWELGWKRGDYLRTDVHLNRGMASISLANLPGSYSQKSLFLKNVVPGDSMYKPGADSQLQSRVLPPEPVRQGQAAVAFTKVSQGWVGYIGDVNNEDGSQKVVMEVCRFAADRAGSM